MFMSYVGMDKVIICPTTEANKTELAPFFQK